MERALQADEAERLYTQRAVERIEHVPDKDLSAAARNFAQSKALNITRAQLLRDRPTEIKETRSVSENLSILRRLGVVEGDAFEIFDAEALPDANGSEGSEPS